MIPHFFPPLSSYENANDDSPDCSGGPKFLRNKSPDAGVFKITYTYSVNFVVGAPVSLSHSLSLLLAAQQDWQDASLMCCLSNKQPLFISYYCLFINRGTFQPIFLLNNNSIFFLIHQCVK